MGASLDKPSTDKHNEHGSGNGLRYGVASMQGWRIEMEDAHCAITGLSEELKEWSFFAVFDGHAGAKVSAHCAEHLLDCIVNSEDFRRADFTEGIRAGFLNLDDRMRKLPELGEEKSGSTAVCALISPNQIFVANCGDSRAVLCNNKRPTFSTQDHKPVLPSEKERIQRAGGSVMIQRINGSLAVSRALGDYEFKNVEGKGPCEQLVSPEPEVFVIDRHEDDEFLVLACDGVWDVMSNEDICSFIGSRLLLTDDLESITSQVVDTCFYKDSRDNMSIVLVTFPKAPQPSAKVIDEEKQLEKHIEERIKDLTKGKRDMSFSNLFQKLTNAEIPGLPPGGGIFAKYAFIEDTFKQYCPQVPAAEKGNCNKHESLNGEKTS